MRRSNDARAFPRYLSIRSVSLTCLLFVSAGLLACGGPPSSSERSASGEIPEITDELIYERINDAWIRNVPPEQAPAPGDNRPNNPISWDFDHDEPKEIAVVDKQQNGTHATIVLDIKTSSSPRAKVSRQLAGQIKTEWELRTGWVLRRWEIVHTENISMKYKDVPKSPPENSNANAR
jgi:hypothetical protein